MAHPALIPAVAFAIGIAIARYMPMPIWGIIIPAVATVVFAALGRTLPSLAIGLAMTGYICGDSALPDPLPPSLDGTKVNIIGEVLKAEPGTDRTRYVIEVSQCTEVKDTKTKNNAKTTTKAKAKTGAENIETSMPSKASADRKSDTKGKIYAEKFRTVLYDNGIYTYRPGDIVSATGILRDARAKDIVPDAADYNRYLYLQGVNSVLWLTKEEMYPISKASDNTLSNILDKARAATTNAIIDSGAGSDASAFLTAVIVGDHSYLQPDTDEAFRTSGLAHLLALSGLHVGIIIMFITVCLSWMRPSRYGYRILHLDYRGFVCLRSLCRNDTICGTRSLHGGRIMRIRHISAPGQRIQQSLRSHILMAGYKSAMVVCSRISNVRLRRIRHHHSTTRRECLPNTANMGQKSSPHIHCTHGGHGSHGHPGNGILPHIPIILPSGQHIGFHSDSAHDVLRRTAGHSHDDRHRTRGFGICVRPTVRIHRILGQDFRRRQRSGAYIPVDADDILLPGGRNSFLLFLISTAQHHAYQHVMLCMHIHCTFVII